VITIPPYEVTETGWGEFTIGITINFLSDSIPPVTFQHMLKLFPPPSVPASTKKPVMAEVYDEFVFVNPTEHFHRLLHSGPTKKFDTHFLNPFCK
jgi:YEATS domain-containing protein 4